MPLTLRSSLLTRLLWLPGSALLALAALAALLLLLTGPRLAQAEFKCVNPAGDDNCFATIQAAMDALPGSSGDFIFINAGTYTESVTLTKTISLKGDGSNPPIFRAMPGQRVLTVTGAAVNSSVVISSLVLMNGNAGGEGAAGRGGGVLITGSAQPLLTNLVISNNVAAGAGGGLYAYQGSVVTLTNVTFYSNTASDAGGAYFYANARVTDSHFENNRCIGSETGILGDACFGGGAASEATLTLRDTYFISNSATLGGGGLAGRLVHGTGGSFTRNSCTLSDCTGGGLSAGNFLFTGTLALTGTTVTSNTAFANGGGVYVNGPVMVNSGRLEANTSISSTGGGLYVAGDLVVSGSEFLSNTAYRSGGGAYVAGLVTATDTQFAGNIASPEGPLGAGNGSGGGLYAGGAALLTGGLFENNAAPDGFGGGLNTAQSLTAQGTAFVGNQSRSSGGGAYAGLGATITGGYFERNQADSFGHGGGLHALYAAIEDTQFLSNTTFNGPGGALNANISLTIGGSQFVNNRTTGANPAARGGAVRSGGVTIITQTLFISNSAVAGGALFLDGSAGGELVNTLFARNQGDGAAVYQDSSGSMALLHVTVADTAANPNAAIHVVDGSLAITNTLITSHTIGLSLTAGTAQAGHVLFYNVPTTLTAGVMDNGGLIQNENPVFVNPAANDYHLWLGSAAADEGIPAGVTTDFDGQARPFGGAPDMGYDERVIHPVYLPLVRR